MRKTVFSSLSNLKNVLLSALPIDLDKNLCIIITVYSIHQKRVLKTFFRCMKWMAKQTFYEQVLMKIAGYRQKSVYYEEIGA